MLEMMLRKPFTFDFGQLWAKKGHDIVLKHAKQNLIDCNRIMHEIGLNGWLMYGTLLGIYRDSELIAWDRDVDMGLFMRDMDKINEMIVKMQAAGFQIIRVHPYLFSMLRNDEYIDFSLFSEAGSGRYVTRDVLDRVEPHYTDAKHLNRLDTIEYEGDIFLIPADTVILLEKWYGQDWKTPQRNKYAYT